MRKQNGLLPRLLNSCFDCFGKRVFFIGPQCNVVTMCSAYLTKGCDIRAKNPAPHQESFSNRQTETFGL